MAAVLQWSIIVVLSVVALVEALALTVLSRRVRDLTHSRRELSRLHSRVEAIESPAILRIDPPSPSIPSGPMRTNRRQEAPLNQSPTLIAVPNLVRMPDHSESHREGLGRRYRELWARAEAGESAARIAQDLGYPIGHIELILNLRKSATDMKVPS